MSDGIKRVCFSLKLNDQVFLLPSNASRIRSIAGKRIPAFAGMAGCSSKSVQKLDH
jgi:hypothetical protein